eukprot:6213604-Pyramimonas_sp.AAC.1
MDTLYTPQFSEALRQVCVKSQACHHFMDSVYTVYIIKDNNVWIVTTFRLITGVLHTLVVDSVMSVYY